MVQPKGWINQRWEEFMPEARSCVKVRATGTSQPAMGGTDAGSETLRYFPTGGLGGVPGGQGEPRRGRGGRAVDRGIRDGLEGEPLQDLESDVLGELLSAAGAARGDPESQRGLEAVRN